MDARTHRFPLFDSLRAIAALSIFFFHISFVLHLFSGRAVSPWLAQLNVGVPIFFLISGFLLYRPFAQARFSGEAEFTLLRQQPVGQRAPLLEPGSGRLRKRESLLKH